MTSNCDELVAIKQRAQEIFGPKRFKYDYVIFPRRDGDISPCRLRVDFKTLQKTVRSDPDLYREFQSFINGEAKKYEFSPKLYHCDSCLNGIFIDCRGQMRFCLFSDIDCGSVNDAGFAAYSEFTAKLLNMKGKGPCIRCRMRDVCFRCPQSSRLETGSLYKKIPYYCRLAKEFIKHTPK
jgi:sulfatase maturation enzyme AslB (radical SAM superfamily)